MKNMKRFLALALIIVSILAIAAPAMAATYKYVDVADQTTVNLRSAPVETPGNILVRIPHASKVTVLSASGNREKVTYYSYTGYVMSK